MPKVTKLKPRSKRVSKKSLKGIAGRIRSVSDTFGGIKLLLYGQSKTGKTRLACTFPKPLLLIGVAGYGIERGTKSVSNVKGVDFVGLERTEELETLIKLDYASFVLDTAGGLQERVVNEYTQHEATVRKDWRHVSKSDWGPINSKTMEVLQLLLNLADSEKKSIIIIAHERAFNTDSESDLLIPHVGAALTPGVASWLDGASDYIGQCYKREETRKETITVGDEEVVQHVPTGKIQYCLRVGEDPVYKTGFRVPVGTVLPDAIVNPTFSKLKELMKGA